MRAAQLQKSATVSASTCNLSISARLVRRGVASTSKARALLID